MISVELYNKVVLPTTRLQPKTDAEALGFLGEMVEALIDLDADFVMARTMYQAYRRMGQSVRNSFLETINDLTSEDEDA